MSSFSRIVDDCPIGIPQLSDLRESGAIEQDADIVISKVFFIEDAIASSFVFWSFLAKCRIWGGWKMAKKRVKNGLFQPSDLQVPNSYQIFTKLLSNFSLVEFDRFLSKVLIGFDPRCGF